MPELKMLESGSLHCTHILVVEDQDDMRAWLADVAMQAFPGAQASTCATLAQADRWLSDHPAAASGAEGGLVALIDLGLPDGRGISLVRKLSDCGGHALPVITTIFDDDESLCEAIAAGAQGYLLKEHSFDTLVQYLRRIGLGEPPLSPRIARRILACMQRQTLAVAACMDDTVRLSPRETEVLGIIGRGLRVGEVAQVLGLTEHTVSGYVKAIYRKLNISSRAEAALEASRRRLV